MKTKPLVLLNITLAICLVASLILSSGTITVGNTDYTVKKEEYDPWADINDDGTINMKDIYYLIQRFTTSGIPTKNVNVTNWLLEFPVRVTNFPLDEQGNIRVNSTCCTSSQHSNATQKDAVEITALEWTLVQLQYGVILYSNVHNWVLPFAFSPKGQLINVTDLWITITMTTSQSNQRMYFDLTVNDNRTLNLNVTITDYWQPHLKSYHITDVNVHQLIRSGINTLEFHDVSGSDLKLWIFRVIVFTEYEYQA